MIDSHYDIERISELSGWKDISAEKWREYEFVHLFFADTPNTAVASGFKNKDVPKKVIVHIHDPIALLIRDSGAHLVVDGSGVTHYIRCGWHRLSWKADNYADF